MGHRIGQTIFLIIFYTYVTNADQVYSKTPFKIIIRQLIKQYHSDKNYARSNYFLKGCESEF